MRAAFERIIDARGVLAAGLRHSRLAAAAALHAGGDGLDDGTGVEAGFDRLGRAGCHQHGLAVLLADEHACAGFRHASGQDIPAVAKAARIGDLHTGDDHGVAGSGLHGRAYELGDVVVGHDALGLLGLLLELAQLLDVGGGALGHVEQRHAQLFGGFLQLCLDLVDVVKGAEAVTASMRRTLAPRWFRT